MASRSPLRIDPGFGVYVHWPFCLSKCPYCDFNSHVRRNPVDEDRYVEAFRVELAHRAKLTRGRTVGSVFFGGGTPSLMAPETVEAILAAIADNWTIEPRYGFLIPYVVRGEYLIVLRIYRSARKPLDYEALAKSLPRND